MRDYWRGEPETLAEFASRLTGSADLYENDGRGRTPHQLRHRPRRLHAARPRLLQRQAQRGQRRGRQRRREPQQLWNCGVEGETDDLEVVALREQQKRNFLRRCSVSQGVPMLLHGDELRPDQGGNNNVYAQTSRSPDRLGAARGASRC
jgi:glycogen operon protein